NPDGSIGIPIPADTATVRLFFNEPRHYSWVNWVSAIAWVAALFLFALRLAPVRNRLFGFRAVWPRGFGMPSNGARTAEGFSLVELLLVVIIVAIIAAISIPSLIASRRAANDAAAIATLRTLHSAQITYFSAGGQNQNYASLSDLGAAALLDDHLGGADTVNKADFTYTVSRPASAPYNVYSATALADDFGTSGSRDFLVSNAGVIYATSTEGSMSCTNGVPDMTGGSPIQ